MVLNCVAGFIPAEVGMRFVGIFWEKFGDYSECTATAVVMKSTLNQF